MGVELIKRYVTKEDVENLKHCLWIDDENYDKVETAINTNSDQINRIASSYIDCTTSINELENKIIQIEETLQKTPKRKRRIKKVRITL